MFVPQNAPVFIKIRPTEKNCCGVPLMEDQSHGEPKALPISRPGNQDNVFLTRVACLVLSATSSRKIQRTSCSSRTSFFSYPKNMFENRIPLLVESGEKPGVIL